MKVASCGFFDLNNHRWIKIDLQNRPSFQSSLL